MGDKEALPRRGAAGASTPAEAVPHGGATLGGAGERYSKMAGEQTKPGALMSLREHLGELKRRLKVVAIAFIASFVFWLLFPAGGMDPSALFTGMYRPMISMVLDNAKGLAQGRLTLIMGGMTDPLEIYFISGAVMSMLTSSPVIGYEFYKFVEPAFKPNEKSKLMKFMAGFLGLFTTGALIGYFILLPAMIRFMTYFGGIVGASSIVNASDYYGMVFIGTGATALAFTTPAIFLLLVDLGVLSTNALAKNRLIVYLILYVMIAMLVNEPVVGHFGMFFPIVGMLELSIILGRRIERKRGVKPNVLLAPASPKCKHCNSDLGSSKSFCPHCGKAIT